MKFKCGYTDVEKEEIRVAADKHDKEMAQWHDFFAWWPMQLEPGDCRWLETVQRRVIMWAFSGEVTPFGVSQFELLTQYRSKQNATK